MAPGVRTHPGTRPTEIGEALWTPKSLAHPAHPSTEDYDDTLEAHYACLEHLLPCACISGLVFVGYVDEYGEEREASYPCRRCADKS